jgi:RND family efflux transporter MFP subunit
MTRRRALLLGAAALVVLGAAGVAVTLRDLVGGGVPVVTVRRGPFVRRVVAEGNLTPVKATPITVPLEAQEALKISWIVPDGSRVKAGETVVRFDPTDMRKNLEDGEADEATARSKVEGKRAESVGAVRNLDRDAGIAERELDYARRFQSKDPEIFSRAEIIQSEIDEGLASERRDHARDLKGMQEKLTKADLDLLEIDRRKARLKIDLASKGLEALEVRAPHDGILAYERRGDEVAKVGDQVWPGMALAEIPRLDAMDAEVHVLEADAGGLAVGKPAAVVLEARPGEVHEAKVKSVAALAKPRAGRSPVQYFHVVLELDRTDPAVMKPGQRVVATLVLEEIADAITVPRAALEERDGKKVVYRRNTFGFEPVEVTVGSMAPGRVVIASGLGEGDVVALRDPSAPADGPAPGDAAAPPARAEASVPGGPP